MVDYSKWVRSVRCGGAAAALTKTPNTAQHMLTAQLLASQDALELSDDSDIEVHPNVDKRSFIRAKQNQIHQERLQRKNRIEALHYERAINDGLLRHVSGLLTTLKAHASEAAGSKVGEVAFRAVMESASRAEGDKLPPRPDCVRSEEGQPATYSKMMVALLDQVNKAVDEKQPDDRYGATLEELQGHVDKIEGLQKEIGKTLAELEKEDKKKITSADIHTGFDSSYVAKAKPEDKKGEQTVELLNPNFSDSQEPSSSSAKEIVASDDAEDAEASPVAKRFAQIKANDYHASLQFLSQNPQIVSERETDGLLVMAFDAALSKEYEFARQCVHQALLLQYCRLLGKDGVSLFFKRVTTRGHQAQEIFYKDVQETYTRIKNRSLEILAEKSKEEAEGNVEQIQLQAVEPGTVIQIRVPPAESEDAEVKKAREIFENFQPDMKAALESGKLDEVNKVLGKMKVDEAEELVGLFSEVRDPSVMRSGFPATLFH